MNSHESRLLRRHVFHGRQGYEQRITFVGFLNCCLWTVNVCSYGGGTHPWNKSGGAVEPSTEDGLIEVVGLTTYQLVSSDTVIVLLLTYLSFTLTF